MAKPLLRIDYAVLCDEIRKEDSGKLILIGVYSGDVMLKSFPGKVALAAYVLGEALGQGEATIELKYSFKPLSGKSKNILLRGRLSVDRLDQTREFTSPISRVPIEFTEPGTLSLDYRLDNGRWRNILRKNVIALPAGSIESSRPS